MLVYELANKTCIELFAVLPFLPLSFGRHARSMFRKNPSAMCYHYSISRSQKDILKEIQVEWEKPFEPVFHASGFNFPQMPVITSEKPGTVQLYHWGLIPHWEKSLQNADKIRAQTLNARADSIFTKPAFRSYTNNRCVVLADGFFEWMEHKKKKYPHYVHLNEFEVFGFAGLYAHWTDKETGEILHTFTIITTEANPLMARVHNTKERMPVILPQQEWQHWLDPSLTREQMEEMLHPCDDTGMKAYSISKLITTRGAQTNVPEIREPFEYAELASSEQRSLFD
jgi:putative SOS response-associated peptidase YedK